jgi:hypothetical protein
MPKRSAKRFPKAPWLKRLLVLACAAALLGAGAGRSDLLTRSLAAWADDSQGDGPERKVTVADCDFQRDPASMQGGFKAAIARHRDEIARATAYLANNLTASTSELALVAPQDIPRKNFIDNYIFDTMAKANVQAAPLCTDEEFVRRVYLDLTGRIPAATDVTKFVNDKSANKRDALVDALSGTPEYVDKWTMFYGDLFRNNARSVNVNRFTGGRDAFYKYIKDSLAANKPYDQMVRELITANGDNFVEGAVNFMVGGNVPMGPAQDTMDGRAVQTAAMFLGVSAVDCLLCHSGAGHLDNVNLWGKEKTRLDAWGLSAYFARVRQVRTVISQQPNYFKFTVSELPAGEYLLNTDSGNRQPRAPIDGKNSVAPKYLFGDGGPLNAGENRRQALARLITADKQFARAAVNYVWEKLMVEALVSPSNAFDLARLDPAAKLPDGWTLQPANPELLDALANDFIKNKYDLRLLIASIAKSNTYQLSAQYPGNWNLSLVPYYARKFVRRLDAEEIHDAIVKATGVKVTTQANGQTIDGYQLRDTLNQPTMVVQWAMQLPDTAEPRGNTQVLNFLNSFIRGDRDAKPRSLEPSIMQALNLMNHQFVMQRIHQANAGSLVARLLADQTLTPDQLVTQLYLNTLARNPTTEELNKLTPFYSSQTRRDATEGIQWALLNKIDFIFNY